MANGKASEPIFAHNLKHRPKMLQTPIRAVFHLEMLDRAGLRPRPPVAGFVTKAVDPPDPGLNRRFYCSVGAQWHWTDRLTWSEIDWRKYVDRDFLKTFVGKLDGVEVGYFELEVQASGNVEIVYFGLLPDYIGKGLGGSFLSAAVKRAWELPGTKRVWLHTCTQDHKHALTRDVTCNL